MVQMTPANAFADIMRVLNRPMSDHVSFTGSEPALPTTIPMPTAGSAALAAVGAGVDALWQLKGGSPQKITVDMKHGAAAVRTQHYLRHGTEKTRRSFASVSAFFKCGDGRWLRTHGNFDHHAAAAARVLECDVEHHAMKEAALKHAALDLENRILDEGGCAYMLRSLEEWADHDHAKAVAHLPVLEIIKIGEAPVKPLPSSDRPLGGLRVLDLTRIIAGPMIGRTLAEHGATVMRIASPNLPFIKSIVIDTGFGKHSAHIDLEAEDGPDTLRALVQDADVFVQGYRQGSLAKRGFSPDDIAREFPGTVYVSLSAWSHEGPWSHRRGYDSLLQCATGWALELGGADAPVLQPAQAIDYVSGYLGAVGAMEALRRRATEGGTWLVRLSLMQTRNWINGLGRIDHPDISTIATPTEDDLPGMILSTDSDFGPLHYLGHTLRLADTPGRWTSPPVPLGTHAPAWPT